MNLYGQLEQVSLLPVIRHRECTTISEQKLIKNINEIESEELKEKVDNASKTESEKTSNKDSLALNSPSMKELTTVSSPSTKDTRLRPISQESSSKTAPSKCDQYFTDFEDIVKKKIAQIDATSFIASEKVKKLTKKRLRHSKDDDDVTGNNR